jgi:hypothetical protein
VGLSNLFLTAHRTLTQQTTQRTIRTLTWALVSSPLLLLFLFLTLAVHVRVGLGHWPTPVFEDYQTMAYRLHVQAFLWVALFALYAALPLWLVSLCFRVFRISLRAHLIQAGVYAVGWVLIILYAYVDPCRFAEWFLD